MNYENFKNLLLKSKIRVAVIGGVISLASIAMLISLLVMHETKIAYWIVTAVFVLIGFPLLILSIKDRVQINAGSWPLLKAINERDRDYLLWVYNNEIISNVSGVDVGKSSNIVVYNRKGKMIQIILGKKASLSANTVISYLASEFPDAYIGFSDENRAAVGKILNKKM